MAITKTNERTGPKSDLYKIISTATADTTTIELNGLADVIFVSSVGSTINSDTFELFFAYESDPGASDWDGYRDEFGNNPWAAASTSKKIANIGGVKKIKLTRTGEVNGSVEFQISVSRS